MPDITALNFIPRNCAHCGTRLDPMGKQEMSEFFGGTPLTCQCGTVYKYVMYTTLGETAPAEGEREQPTMLRQHADGSETAYVTLSPEEVDTLECALDNYRNAAVTFGRSMITPEGGDSDVVNMMMAEVTKSNSLMEKLVRRPGQGPDTDTDPKTDKGDIKITVSLKDDDDADPRKAFLDMLMKMVSSDGDSDNDDDDDDDEGEPNGYEYDA